MQPNKKPLNETCNEIGVKQEIFLSFVEHEWIHRAGDDLWSEEDALRARLIVELQNDFGVNDEAVPIILHLIDQLNAIKSSFEQRGYR